MILSIHQPSYFPWLGLLDKIRKSDVYMVMDEVQLSDSGYQHRNLFLTPQGKAKFLTVPIVRKSYLGRTYCEIEIAGGEWRRKHFDFIANSYGKHPFAAQLMPYLERFFAAEYRLLAEAVLASMLLVLELFGIRTRIIRQSEMNYDRALRRGELVVALARAAHADCYLSGSGGKEYLDETAFRDGLALRYNEFRHPQYVQRGAPAFVPGLSCVDALFNIGTDGGRALLFDGGNGR